MKFGFSIYSLWNAMRRGEMTVEEAFAWIAENGGDHIEIIDFGPQEEPEKLAELSQKYNLPISAYSIGSMLAQGDEANYEAELTRLKGQIDKARIMGTKLVRCDMVRVMMGRGETGVEIYDRIFPLMVKGARELADYAAQYDMEITIENHGTLMNGADRVKRLLLAVDRPNYGCTVDIGNALCVDEDPEVCVEALLPFAKRVHIKDFYVRKDPYVIGARHLEGYVSRDPGALGDGSWLTTKHKRFLRGSIIGHGDIDMRAVIQKIVDAGYDGDMTIEFEGMEEPKLACKLSMDNLRQIVEICKK